jgi:CRP-like cAMP-binding protein
MGNRNLMLTQVDAGGIFGELSIIDGGPRSATAVALDDCEVIKISPAEFQEGLKNVPDWFMSVSRVLAQRIRLTDSRLSLSGPTVNEANICAILIYLLSGPEAGEGISLEEVEKTLVELLHIPHTELQETFDTLVKKKLIQINQSIMKCEFIEQLEKHLERLRQSFASSIII